MRNEVVGGRDAEIEWGQRILTPKGVYQAHTLVVTWPLKTNGGGCRGSMWVDVDMHIEVVGCQVG